MEKRVDTTGYEELMNVLHEAFEQASKGKGKDRHATGESFINQPIFWIEETFQAFNSVKL